MGDFVFQFTTFNKYFGYFPRELGDFPAFSPSFVQPHALSNPFLAVKTGGMMSCIPKIVGPLKSYGEIAGIIQYGSYIKDVKVAVWLHVQQVASALAKLLLLRRTWAISCTSCSLVESFPAVPAISGKSMKIHGIICYLWKALFCLMIFSDLVVPHHFKASNIPGFATVSVAQVQLIPRPVSVTNLDLGNMLTPM